jgi:phospholipid/cholesterol/gamma-HCH transport system substrate-binding protein
MKRRIIAAAVAGALIWSACSAGESDEPRVFKAHFTRAVQLFPGVTVKVLGVDVGRVDTVRNVDDAVEVTFKLEDPEIKIPSDVQAAIVPVSLLGERYVQLFPAYEGGPQLEPGTTIPLERTAVPAEGDELLTAFEDYLGELDPETVEEFVTNTASVIEGRGERLNDLIGSATEVVATLASERDALADMIVQFNTITQTLSTRQDALGRLITTYNVVGTTIEELRGSLEGTVTGLNDAAAALAGLLSENRANLDADIDTLTRTTRTLDRNIKTFARTGRWARKLFKASSRSFDYDREWLRLSNQGGPLVELIMWRLQDRLIGLCLRLELPNCTEDRYWQQNFPELFCIGILECPGVKRAPRTAEEALRDLPEEIESMLERATKKCVEGKKPKRCRPKEEKDPNGIRDVLDDLVQSLGGGLSRIGVER